jgi:hypothetical protein
VIGRWLRAAQGRGPGLREVRPETPRGVARDAGRCGRGESGGSTLEPVAAGPHAPAREAQGVADGFGTLMVVPTTSVLELMFGLSARISSTVVPYLSAMAERVSPDFTLYFL